MIRNDWPVEIPARAAFYHDGSVRTGIPVQPKGWQSIELFDVPARQTFNPFALQDLPQATVRTRTFALEKVRYELATHRVQYEVWMETPVRSEDRARLELGAIAALSIGLLAHDLKRVQAKRRATKRLPSMHEVRGRVEDVRRWEAHLQGLGRDATSISSVRTASTLFDEVALFFIHCGFRPQREGAGAFIAVDGRCGFPLVVDQQTPRLSMTVRYRDGFEETYRW